MSILKISLFPFSNFSFYVLIVCGLIYILFRFLVSSNSKLLGNWFDLIYLSILDTVTNFLPLKLKMYLPFAFGLFLYILVGNLVGLVPYSYSITCELILTLTFSLSILLGVTIVGFKKHGLHYFSYFLPSGTPLGLVPLLVLIELISYFAKGLSLGIRLAGNIISGHLLLHIIASFIFKLIPVITIVVILPLIILILLMGLEFIIAFLQAYVFVILFSVYVKDAIYLH